MRYKLPLPTLVAEKIDLARYHIHNAYYAKLREFGPSNPVEIGVFAPTGPSRPSSPETMFEILREYAGLLFVAESQYYEHLAEVSEWCRDLAARTEANLMSNLESLQTAINGDVNLNHHASFEQIRLCIRATLDELARAMAQSSLETDSEIVEPIKNEAEPEIKSQTHSTEPLVAEPTTETVMVSVSDLPALLKEGGLSAKSAAKKLGISATSIRRHLSGNGIREKTLDEYENLLSKVLKRPIEFRRA